MSNKIKTNGKRYLKFISTILISGIIGAIFGMCSFKLGGKLEQYMPNIPQFIVDYSSILMATVCAIVMIIGLLVIMRGKSLLARYNEDEEYIDQQISKLVTLSMVTTVSAVGILFSLYGIVVSMRQVDSMITAVVGLIIGIFLTTTTEVLTVNFVKKAYPNRKGDPLSVKFAKEWIKSCDEGEKQIIFMASYKTFGLMKHVMLGLFVVMILLGLVIKVDFMVYLLLGIIYIVNNLAYLIYTYRLKNLNCI